MRLQAIMPNRRDRLRAEKHVLGDGQVGRDAQFLMHHADPARAGVAGGAEVHWLAIDSHRRRESACTPAMIFIRRALARAVLASKAVDVPGAQSEIDAAQRLDAAERLRDAGEFEQGS